MKRLRILLATAMIAVVGFPLAAAAYEPAYNFNFIISDDDLLDYTSMNQNVIQQFLVGHSSQLANLNFTVTDPVSNQTVQKPASQLIFEAAQNYKINPKVILVTLQKEESLVDDGGVLNQTHVDWAMGYGVCDSCSVTDPAVQTFKGFPNQVDLGTKAFRRYYDQITTRGFTTSGWGPAITKQLFCSDFETSTDGFCTSTSTPTNVTPANFVTSALYTYTPHFHGNYNFWKIWTRFGFNLKRLYPDGSLLKAKGSSTIYLIQNGVKRKFVNLATFYSRYNSKNLITVPADHLLQYEDGRDISFANYSLLASPQGGTYLLVDDVKRPIKSSAVFKSAGFMKEEVVKVKWSDLNQFPDGDPITADNIFPAGRLMQNSKTGGVFFVKDGVRHAVYSKLIFKDQFGLQKPLKVTPAKLASFTDGAPVGFRDGDLVQSKSSGTIYFISNGYRLPIASPTVFAAYRFSWTNVIKADDNSISAHPVGPTLDIDSSVQTASRP